MIQSVLIEIRPGLRSCSVCVVMKDNLREAKVKIRKNRILLSVNSQDHNILLKDFEVEPLTMTCFAVERETVSFRIEVATIHCPLPGPVPRLKKMVPFQPNQSLKMSCKCGCPVTENVTFKRVLPLPSNGIELADMFCHFNSQMSASLSPKPEDCLYSTHYISVSKDHLKNVKLGPVIKCSRCLASLGLYKKDMVQLWNVSLDIPRESRTPEEEFKRIVRQAIEDSFVIFLKIFLECTESNAGLLISVMDKQLLVSRASEDLQLKTCSVLKLKYEYHGVCNKNLRTFFENDGVHCIEVPQSILNDGLDFLMRSSEEIPPKFRIVDGELMAYLEVSS